jgi:hypothetical protein
VNPGFYSVLTLKYYSFYPNCQAKSSKEFIHIGDKLYLTGIVCYIFLKLHDTGGVEIFLDRIVGGNIKIVNIFRY